MSNDRQYEETEGGFFTDIGTWKIAGLLALVLSVGWWMFH